MCMDKNSAIPQGIQGIKEENDLNLPFDPDFHSQPPQYSVAEMIKICEVMLPYWNRMRFDNPPELLEFTFTLD